MKAFKLLFLGLTILTIFSCGNKQGEVIVDATTVEVNFAALENYEKVTGNAEIKFNEYVHELPEVSEGTVINYSFFFVNSGDKPLVLSKVRGSCGCTNASGPTHPILPGEKGRIDATIDTEGKSPGKAFGIYVYVESNAVTDYVKLRLKGKLKE